jgi:hypothetical protein
MASTKKKDGPYSTEKWGGKTKYGCNSCSYDTLNEAHIKEHVRAPHPQHETDAAVAAATGSKAV